jgi:hypothetical protein
MPSATAAGTAAATGTMSGPVSTKTTESREKQLANMHLSNLTEQSSRRTVQKLQKLHKAKSYL